ncbi:uncharacterized protein H6S33_011141 [Morchella sextelata]|uniref:uncharacterized protein n=1 Tax=Morchella sextelata TaxID=1174677 RepID=UPI001D05359A|nr:uncharacterized protein H6S33_011141 [Morchella sextelata]KAH0611876.1 hypothetical protein H6S33_011141 [Morchella sextelata]
MGNSHSVGSGISDLFYPDNPSRRGRCQELKNDITLICAEFKELQARVEEQEKRMDVKVTELLHAHGYSSFAELEAKIEQVLANDELAKWKEMTKELSRDHGIQSWILTISGLGAVATGVVLGGLVAFGVIAGTVAIAASEVILPVLALMAVVALVWGAIAGAKERAELQEAIKKMAFSRVEAKQQLQKLKVYSDWMSNFDIWLNNPIFTQHPELFEQQITGDFKADMENTNRPAIIKILHELDSVRKSWTNEDPDVTNPPLTGADLLRIIAANTPFTFGTTPLGFASAPVALASAPLALASVNALPEPVPLEGFEEAMPMSTLHCTWHDTDAGHRAHMMDLRLTVHKGRTDCEAVEARSGETWLLHAKVYPPLPDTIRLGEVLFKLQNETTGEVRDDCKVMVALAA